MFLNAITYFTYFHTFFLIKIFIMVFNKITKSIENTLSHRIYVHVMVVFATQPNVFRFHSNRCDLSPAVTSVFHIILSGISQLLI